MLLACDKLATISSVSNVKEKLSPQSTFICCIGDFLLGGFSRYNAMNLLAVARSSSCAWAVYHFNVSGTNISILSLPTSSHNINGSIFNKFSSEIHHDKERRKNIIGEPRKEKKLDWSIKFLDHPAPAEKQFFASPDEYQKAINKKMYTDERHVKWTKNIFQHEKAKIIFV